QVVDVARVEDQQGQEDRRPEHALDARRQPAELGADGIQDAPQARSAVCSPRSPCGRKTRIRIRIPKMIDSVQADPGACQVSPSLKLMIRPISSAPSVAPVRFPIPPSTAAVNAYSPSWKPRSKRALVKNMM